MKRIYHILSALLVTFVMASCSQDTDLDNNQGYLSLSINSLVSTHTPGARADVPEDYNAKTLHVEIQNAQGVVVLSTDDFANDATFQSNIPLMAGSYTVVAHSANWDGNASGFDVPYYYGSTTVQVKAKSLVKAAVTCTLANVKLTVKYDKTFVDNFQMAATTITSKVAGIDPLKFVMNETTQSGYIPVGSFTAKLDVVNKNSVFNSMTREFTDVKARDHYILNFKLAEEGNLGDGTGAGVQVEVDESTNTYTYTFEVPRKSAISLITRAANAWSNFAMLSASVTAKTANFDVAGLTLQWRQAGATDWNEIPNGELTVDAKDNVTATLKGLTPQTSYEYRLRYVNGDNEVVAEPVSFTTEQQVALYNGGFENWYKNGNSWYPNENGIKFWDTSNPGSTSIGEQYNVTTQTTEVVHSGSSSAMLSSKKVVIAFAAASLYTGEFISVDISTKAATLNWGVPFSSRPTALKGFMQYAPVAINNAGKNLPSGAPAKGEMDQCGMYCALLSESLVVNNGDMSTFPNWETDSRVIAYGSLPTDQSVSTNKQWKEVNIPLVYRDLSKKPTHLLIVFSASKYGDYFHGGAGSTLYLDDFSLEYGDAPAVK